MSSAANAPEGPGLKPDQCKAARRFERAGLTLREIADLVGASRNDIALYLYGGIADFTPRIGRPIPTTPTMEEMMEHIVPAPTAAIPPPPAPALAKKSPRPRATRVWTPERDQQLADLAGTMGQAAIAVQIGVSRNSVHLRAAELGISLDLNDEARKRRTRNGIKARQGHSIWTGERIADARRRCAEGATADDLSAAYGTNVQSIKAAARAHGFTPAEPAARRRALEDKRGTKAAEILRRTTELKEAAERRLQQLGATPSPPVRASTRALRTLSVARPGHTNNAHDLSPSGQGSWFRLQHPSGQWLSLDGLSLVDERANGFICRTGQLKAARKCFSLAAECEAVPEPAWSPRDQAYARTIL